MNTINIKTNAENKITQLGKINVGQKVEFHDMVFADPFYPYYEKYKGHVFEIDHFMEEDEKQQHIWLRCITDSDIIVDGYVELYQLKIVGEC